MNDSTAQSPTSRPGGTVASRADKKRREVLVQSLKVFAKEGFGGTDVQVIADLAGVGKGTVYRYFGNKEQLFLATARFCLEELAAYVRHKLGNPQGDGKLLNEVGAVELLRRVGRAYAEFYARNPQAVEIMIQERAQFRESVFPTHLMHRTETRAEFDKFLHMAIHRGDLRQVDVTHAANAFSDLLYGTVVNGCLEGGASRLVERVEQAVELLLDGLVARNQALTAGVESGATAASSPESNALNFEVQDSHATDALTAPESETSSARNLA